MFVYNRSFLVLFYMCLYLLKISMLEKLSDSLQLIDFGICLISEGRWFEEVCIVLFFIRFKCASITDIEHSPNYITFSLLQTHKKHKALKIHREMT